jgi:uncharacterized protein (TIGR02466 family)
LELINQQLQELFPTPVYISELDDTSICDKIYRILCEDRESGSGKYKETEWKSLDFYHQHPELRDFSSMILNEFEKVYDHFQVKRDSIYINNMWGQISNGYNYHQYHIHQNSYFSGILYLRTPQGSGETVFYNNSTSTKLIRPEYNELNRFNCGNYSFTPEKGKLIIFPSWLPHAVQASLLPKELDGERATLAMTTMFKADIRQETTTIIY